jgi:hypothetical protein
MKVEGELLGDIKGIIWRGVGNMWVTRGQIPTTFLLYMPENVIMKHIILYN